MPSLFQAHTLKYPLGSFEVLEQMARLRERGLEAREEEWQNSSHGEHLLYLSRQEGRTVVVASDGRTYLRWLRAPGDKVAETVCFPRAVVASVHAANYQDASVQTAGRSCARHVRKYE